MINEKQQKNQIYFNILTTLNPAPHNVTQKNHLAKNKYPRVCITANQIKCIIQIKDVKHANPRKYKINVLVVNKID